MPEAGTVSGEPVIVPPLVAVTVTVFAEPRLEAVLPALSVMETLAVTVPELPRPVIVQVKRQGEPIAPALTVSVVSAARVGVPVETVKASGATVEIVPSVAVTLAAPALFSLPTPFLEE